MTLFKVNIYSILIKVAYCAILMICNSNQIKSLLLSHHHSTCALVSEILESVLQTVQKQFTYRQYSYMVSGIYYIRLSHLYSCFSLFGHVPVFISSFANLSNN